MTSRRRLAAEDLYRFVLPGGVAISPDGELVAFVRQAVDPESRTYRSQIWIVPAAGGPARPFATAGRQHSGLAWSPDGRRLAFVRTTEKEKPGPGDSQIWIIDRSGGEAWQLTQMRYGAGAPVWSPDGRAIAFTAAVDPTEPPESWTRPMTPSEAEEREKRTREQGRVVRRLFYKSDAAMGLLEDQYTHVWVVRVPDQPGGALPTPVQVTDGPFDHGQPAWSPDGRALAVAAARIPDEVRAFYTRDIWLFPAPGADLAPVNITGEQGAFGRPSFSPDGRWIAATGHRNEYGWATYNRVWRFPAPGNQAEPVCLTAGWDRPVQDTVGTDLRVAAADPRACWAPDGSALYFPASDRGSTRIFRVAAAGGTPEPVTPDRQQVFAWSMDRAGDRIALAVTDFYQPGEVAVAELGTGEQRLLTDLNGELLSEVAFGQLEELPVRDERGNDLGAWLLKPVGWQPGQRYPLVLEIHGGPYGDYGYAFYQEFHLLSAQGYAVLFSNPRGSLSYGQKHAASIDGDWGGGDARDILAALDAALATGWIDPQRVGVTGGSYGGFMTNWLVAHHGSRFAAAITHRCVANFTSFAGVSDIGPWFHRHTHKLAPVWVDFGKLWEASPIRYVEQMHTPLLICHSAQDIRTPLEQAEQLYAALKYLGREVEMVVHPNSNHDLTRNGPPPVRVDRFHHIARWFGRYLPVTPEAYAAIE